MKSIEFTSHRTYPKEFLPFIMEDNTPPVSQQVKPQAGKDPNKLLALKIYADHTFPHIDFVRFGKVNLNNPSDTEKMVKVLTKHIDDSMNNTPYIDVKAQGDYKTVLNWFLDRYSKGLVDYEDITGEGGQMIGTWMVLRNQPEEVRGKNFPSDINRFRDIQMIKDITHSPKYRDILERYKNQAEILQQRKDAREITLINNERYNVAIPLNYGACYTFNNAEGVQATFCTGSSSYGPRWFGNYADDGPLIQVLDKKNENDINGKWQMQSASRQLVNATQDDRYDVSGNDKRFAQLFPGLMKEIVNQLIAHKQEIETLPQEVNSEQIPKPYNVDEEIERIKNLFPESYASVPPGVNPDKVSQRN